jgi:SIR2-like domain
MAGHMYLVRGDIRRLSCDSWLMPTDSGGSVTDSWKTDPVIAHHLEGTLLKRCLDGWPVRSRSFRMTDDRRPAIWATDVGGGTDTPLEWYIEGVEAFLSSAASERPASRWRDRPLLALPLIGTGHGGADARKGGLIDQLLRRLVKFVAEGDVDVAIVIPDPKPMAAAQHVRWGIDAEMRRSGKPGLWEALPLEVGQAAASLGQAATAGGLVVFFGAGLSLSVGLPDWDRLLEQLALAANVEGDWGKRLKELDRRDQALLIEAELGPERMKQEVSKRLSGGLPGLLHSLLATLPINEFVTTNFDTLFEEAASAAGLEAAVLPYEARHGLQRWLLKLHGSVDRSDIILTRGDYLGLPERSGALAGIVQALLITKQMLFLGYSLQDEDFHQLVYDVRKAVGNGDHRIHLGTVILPESAGFLGDIWKGQFQVLAMSDLAPPDQKPNLLVEMFLDRLVAETFRDSVTYLLDPAYRDLLDPSDVELAQALQGLQSLVADASTPARAALKRFFNETGAIS